MPRCYPARDSQLADDVVEIPHLRDQPFHFSHHPLHHDYPNPSQLAACTATWRDTTLSDTLVYIPTPTISNLDLDGVHSAARAYSSTDFDAAGVFSASDKGRVVTSSPVSTEVDAAAGAYNLDESGRISIAEQLYSSDVPYISSPDALEQAANLFLSDYDEDNPSEVSDSESNLASLAAHAFSESNQSGSEAASDVASRVAQAFSDSDRYLTDGDGIMPPDSDSDNLASLAADAFSDSDSDGSNNGASVSHPMQAMHFLTPTGSPLTGIASSHQIQSHRKARLQGVHWNPLSLAI